MHEFFEKYNANPWNMNLPDCAIRATSLALNMPYVDVCKKLRVSFRKGHGLIRDSGIYLQKIKNAFDDYFDVVVDFDEELPPDDIPNIDYDTTHLFDDDDEYADTPPPNSEMDLAQWMVLNRGLGMFLVGLHNPIRDGVGHLVCASTAAMKFFDTWDCSKWKVNAWMRVRKRELSEN